MSVFSGRHRFNVVKGGVPVELCCGTNIKRPMVYSLATDHVEEASQARDKHAWLHARPGTVGMLLMFGVNTISQQLVKAAMHFSVAMVTLVHVEVTLQDSLLEVIRNIVILWQFFRRSFHGLRPCCGLLFAGSHCRSRAGCTGNGR